MAKKEATYYWPLWFSKTLNSAEQITIKGLLPQLGQAQSYLWRALNIYDDFLDGEGKRTELPLANSYFRRYLAIHYRLNLSNDYYRLFNKINNDLDRANKKEVLALKLKIKNNQIFIPKKLVPDKKISSLAQKSLALALGPLALLFALSGKKSHPKFRAAFNFFKYALAAKQLADDSHDWHEDLTRGLITSANLPILLTAQKRNLKLKLKNPATIANLLFATEAAPIIIKKLEYLCARARREMAKISKNKKNILLAKLITPLEKACSKAKKFKALVVLNS
jgi:hypothetical protein